MTRVGFVGVGRMGGAMLNAVLEAGHEVRVHDAIPGRAAEFEPRATAVATARDAASGADVVDVVVNFDRDVLEVCLGPDGVLAGAAPGTVVLIHSTIALDTLRRVADEAPQGVAVCDAAVSGRMGHHSVGDLTVMVGGDAEAVARARPVMDSYGGFVVHLGELGAGLDAKLALNTVRYLSFVAAQEGARLAAATGNGSRIAELVQHAGAMTFTGDLSSNRNESDFDRRVLNAETAQKDLRAAIARGAELGLALPAAEESIGRMHALWGVEAAMTAQRTTT